MSDNNEEWVGFLFDYDYALQYVFICCDYPGYMLFHSEYN